MSRRGGEAAAEPDVQADELRIDAWSGAAMRERMAEAMTIYVRAMDYPSYTGAQRSVAARSHTNHAGFRCRAALLGGRLFGFGYGYTSAAGQHWHDLVRRALSVELARHWLVDAFELSELHVDPDVQGHGVGRALLLSLLEGLPEQRVLLSTPDADTRAFRLYRGLGFVDLARDYMFPGDARPFAVLGAELPLRPAGAEPGATG